MIENLLFSLAGWGVFTFFLGLIVVFVGMTILVGFVTLTGYIMKKNDARKDKKAAEKAALEENKDMATETEDEIPEEVKVAIIAAISAYYMGQGVKNEFRVRKINRI